MCLGSLYLGLGSLYLGLASLYTPAAPPFLGIPVHPPHRTQLRHVPGHVAHSVIDGFDGL